METGPHPLLMEVRNLSKAYGHVSAIQDISLRLDRGEVVGLLGDNGAGKSTLVKCISGRGRADAGTILIDGSEVDLPSTAHAQRLGIEAVFQDLALVPDLDVTANLFLNREYRRSNWLLQKLGWLDNPRMRKETSEILDRLHIRISSVRQRVDELSGGQRQAVAVGRAVAWGRRVVLLDEPSAALGVDQSRVVLDIISRLRDQGLGVLLITHNLQEAFSACDRLIVLRLGRKVADVLAKDVDTRTVVSLITGIA